MRKYSIEFWSYRDWRGIDADEISEIRITRTEAYILIIFKSIVKRLLKKIIEPHIYCDEITLDSNNGKGYIYSRTLWSRKDDKRRNRNH